MIGAVRHPMHVGDEVSQTRRGSVLAHPRRHEADGCSTGVFRPFKDGVKQVVQGGVVWTVSVQAGVHCAVFELQRVMGEVVAFQDIRLREVHVEAQVS